jgi:Protein of unknown function (DUF2975)
MTLPKPADPLLKGAKAVLFLCYATLILGMVALSIGAVTVPTFGKSRVLAEFAKRGVPEDGLWLLAGAMVLIVGLLAVGYAFTRTLHGVINSVGDGDPFHPGNADRLSRMGWLAMIAQVIVLPLASIEGWFKHAMIKKGALVDIGFGIDLGSILLILVLFILARVFRKGTEMREDLEGTV